MNSEEPNLTLIRGGRDEIERWVWFATWVLKSMML